nr:glucarate dehydratase [Raoultella sp. NCTC 9187]
MNTQSTPVVTDMKVIPVAGHDSMLLNIGGAHGAWFTRNIVVLTDSAGNTGIGEAPGRRGYLPDAGGRDSAGAGAGNCAP